VDWSIHDFLTSRDGLGLDIAKDEATLEAVRRNILDLAGMPLDGLKGRRLNAQDFDRIGVSDLLRDVLHWMGSDDSFESSLDEQRWKSFCSLCVSELSFDPRKQSREDAANLLAGGNASWAGVWRRFEEAPGLHLGVVRLLQTTPSSIEGWKEERHVRMNEDAENRLRDRLRKLSAGTHDDAIKKIGAIEAEHGKRRSWVWAKLGASPLANSLEHLMRLASAAANPIGGSSVETSVSAYVSTGYLCDRAAVECLTSVSEAGDIELVEKVVRSLYFPWLEASALHFQELLRREDDAMRSKVRGTCVDPGTCIMFVDGLRYDIASIVAERIAATEHQSRLTYRIAPIPTVTATAKPFATVSHEMLAGGDTPVDFNPRFANTAMAATAQRLRDNMASRGVDILSDGVRPVKKGFDAGWIEIGRLDHIGHSLGARLVSQIRSEIDTIVARVVELLATGWNRIRIVTDHGWILMPGGLPVASVPSHLLETKWSRCAVVKGNAHPDGPVYSWHWNPLVRVASPPGIGVVGKNAEFAHGGVSLQECVVPEIWIERGRGATSASISAVEWHRMRCKVFVETNDPSVRVDIRTNWRQPESSIAAGLKKVGETGVANLAIADDTFEGSAATIVVLDGDGNVLSHMPTTVGEAS